MSGSGMARASDFNASDRAFVYKASGAAMYEVTISKIAMNKGSSDGVKAFAQMMVDDPLQGQRRTQTTRHD
jgi:predicted outer membrane protein